MLFASKIGWAGLVLTLLTTGMLPGVARGAPGSDPNKKEEVPAFVAESEIKKMQEALRNKGHYQGRIDGVFGLQTRDSIRAHQKVENLPTTGQVDTRTANGLGVRPESTWDNSKNAGLEAKARSGRENAGGETKRAKPSAGIRRAEGQGSKTRRKTVSRTTFVEDNRGGGTNKEQAKNEEQKP